MLRPQAAAPIQVARRPGVVSLRIPRSLSPKGTAIACSVVGVLALASLTAMVFMVAGAPRMFRWVALGGGAAMDLTLALVVISKILRSWEFRRENGILSVLSTGLLGTRIRRRDWSRLKSVTVPKVGTSSSENGPSHPIHQLRFEFDGARAIRVLRGTDENVLRWLLEELRSDTALGPPSLKPGAILSPIVVRPKPADSLATLETVARGIRITLPAIGVFTRQPGGILIGSLVLPVFSIVAGAALLYFRARVPAFGPAVLLLGLFIVVGTLFVLAEVNKRVRSGSLEATPEGLEIRLKSPFGTTRQYWPASQVRGIRAEHSGTTTNGIPQMRLRITLEKEEEEFRCFQGRDRAEMDWVAYEVGRVLAASGAELRPASGTCQVCASAMTKGVVLCAKCRTPHHEECWQYTGQCSTFGCREIRYVRD